MKILSAEQIRQWDQYTIEQEPISSIDLMERAASRCTDWIIENFPEANLFSIFCGKGNNGGDGLAIARMLVEKKCAVSIYILEFGHLGTIDFQTNLARLHSLGFTDIHFIQTEAHFYPFSPGTLIIDSLYGTGLNRKLEGVTAHLVEHINNSGLPVLSIDIPSGLFTDHSSIHAPAIKASQVLTLQSYKPAFFIPENEPYIGGLNLLNIGLHSSFLDNLETRLELIEPAIVKAIHKPRKRFSHKGNFGHALLVAGSYGTMGAAVLAARACLRSGVGLLSCHIPTHGYAILQTAVPEAMALVDFNASYTTKVDTDLSRFNVIGIGPGIGTSHGTRNMLGKLLSEYGNPLVIDADALNCIALEKNLLSRIPPGSILTPHPKEFERLFGSTANDFDRIELAMKKSADLNCIIILKGHHTIIADSAHHAFVNSTGNPGMATAGTGDVLTGILTGLLAQGYSSIEAAILGVYLHGLAGDLAAEEQSMEAMIAGDMIEHLGPAFLHLTS